jgi:hypothetical protein
MRLLTLPITVVRVPFEIGFGAAKEAVKFGHGLVAGGEEPVEEKPRPAAPRRRRTSKAGARSGNGGGRSGAAAKRPSRRRTKPSRAPAERSSRPTAPSSRPAETTTAAPPAAEPATASVVTEPTPAATQPSHVSEEPELVAEAAETGAEDGAGAEVAVDEPWPGYDEMTAPDIEERLLVEGPETAAAVSLYEASHKGRASILDAASRSIRT